MITYRIQKLDIKSNSDLIIDGCLAKLLVQAAGDIRACPLGCRLSKRGTSGGQHVMEAWCDLYIFLKVL